MAAITRSYAGLESLLPGPGEQLPDGNVTAVALLAGDIVYLKSDGECAKAIAVDGTNVTERAIGIVPKPYAAGKAITIHCGGVTYNYAAKGTLTPGAYVYLSDSVAGGLDTGAEYSGQKPLGYVEADGGSVRFFEFRLIA
jgi:hypothetical protein